MFVTFKGCENIFSFGLINITTFELAVNMYISVNIYKFYICRTV